MEAKQKILIIQTAFLGDIILTLPLAQTLKKLFPEPVIDFLCIPSTANIFQNNPYIRNAIIYDKKSENKLSKLIEIIKIIKKERYDIVICPHRSLRSALITYFSGAKIRIGFKKNALSFLLTRKAMYKNTEHEIKRNLELVSQIPGIDSQNEKAQLKPELFPIDRDKKEVDELLNEFYNESNGKIICFAPCSKWFTKMVPENVSIKIVNSLTSKGYKIVLIGGSDDKNFCRSIATQAKDNKHVLSMAGKLTPVQSSYVIQRSCVLITVDSAAAHLGAATDTPIVMIYGSTIPALGFYPLTSKNIIIENNELDCRPCTNHGRGSCPEKHFKCMNNVNIDEIINAVESLTQ